MARDRADQPAGEDRPEDAITFARVGEEFETLPDEDLLYGGVDYFESTATLSGAAQDLSGGAAGPAIVVLGACTGTGGVDIYYTDDASAMSTANSYQIADVTGANTGDLEAGDFNLRT